MACPVISALNQPQSKENQGAFMAIKSVIPNSNAIRINMARNNPIRVARFLCSTGNFPVTIEIKIMLSIPKMISKNVKVNKAIQASGCKNISIE